MSIHPQEIAVLLNLTPICYDIQNKILMLIIGINGTPTSNLIKPIIISMQKNKKIYIGYSEKTLTSYCTCLSLFNFMKNYYEELGYDIYNNEDQNAIDEEILPEFIHEFDLAYTLYYENQENEINEIMIRLKAVTKMRLNKMIATEPIIEFI
jgi:muramoyltetrapeptide carboxypeptidase LdcA involved in peptidoglycan recycling